MDPGLNLESVVKSDTKHIGSSIPELVGEAEQSRVACQSLPSAAPLETAARHGTFPEPASAPPTISPSVYPSLSQTEETRWLNEIKSLFRCEPVVTPSAWRQRLLQLGLRAPGLGETLMAKEQKKKKTLI